MHNWFGRLTLYITVIATGLLATGCTSTAMKGTPFYSGEYDRSRGPAEQRINGWPLLYVREPALSVLWPIFEKTDDHLAVRPLFSVYGLDREKREYNFLWPLAQYDKHSSNAHVFPVFWGDDHRVVFPVYWHFDEPFGHGGSSGVIPVYWYSRNGERSMFLSPLWMAGRDADERWRVLMPLFYQRTNDTRSVLITPLWAQGRNGSNAWQALIPMAYWNRQERTLLSPLWAQWKDGKEDRWLAPWALTWAERDKNRTDLWAVGGLARASWGEKPGAHYAMPFYYRKADGDTLLTPFTGWSDKGDFFYPITPLAGVRNGDYEGSWLFPLYSHSVQKKTGNTVDRWMVLSGRSRQSAVTNTWLMPLFHFRDAGSIESSLKDGQRYGTFGKRLWCPPFCWWKNEATVHPASAKSKTNLVHTYHKENGAFPLWSYTHRETPATGVIHKDGSMLWKLYDYKRDTKTESSTNDYRRARVLWRLWHYERSNGDVSVDVFPGFTYDRKVDGFEKTSLFWRLYRNEQSQDGKRKVDVLFVPVKR